MQSSLNTRIYSFNFTFPHLFLCLLSVNGKEYSNMVDGTNLTLKLDWLKHWTNLSQLRQKTNTSIKQIFYFFMCRMYEFMYKYIHIFILFVIKSFFSPP